MHIEIGHIIVAGTDIELPSMTRVRQSFPRPQLADVEAAVVSEFSRPGIGDRIKPGTRVAIGVGSRGIANLEEIARTVVREVKQRGAEPFIVPAMGSHGGATAEGQALLLSEYNIIEAQLGCPVRSSMEVVSLGSLPNGFPIVIDRLASESDLYLVIARIKPHTDFKARVESGVLKMLSIGLGKHVAATQMHGQGMEAFPELIPTAGLWVADHSPFGFGLAIVENAFHEIAAISALPRDNLFERESELLVEAKRLMPRLLFNALDVLVVDEIGKNISGAGMDSNVIGRCAAKVDQGFDAPSIQRIVALDVTEESHGNACGVGLADVTTTRLIEKIDLSTMYANVIAASAPEVSRLPLIMASDDVAIRVAVKLCFGIEYGQARIVRIKNTLSLNEIWCSPSLLDEVRSNPLQTIEGQPEPWNFGSQGMLMAATR
jgi:hypothetical protein